MALIFRVQPTPRPAFLSECIFILPPSSQTANTVGARAVPARSGDEGEETARLNPSALHIRECCEPGTARAPVVVSRCTLPLPTRHSTLLARCGITHEHEISSSAALDAARRGGLRPPPGFLELEKA